jgi:hypothetical protein
MHKTSLGLIIKILLILFLIKINMCFSQINLFDKEEKLVSKFENSIITEFMLGEYAYSIQLPDIPDGAYLETSCYGNTSLHPISFTIIGIRENKNLFYTIFYSLILDKNGFNTDKSYVGYIKRQYGETKNYLIKTKKERVYPENNVFTEKISLSNGIVITTEDRRYIRKIKLPGKDEFYLEKYFYKDCD